MAQIDSSGNNVGIGGTNSLTRTFEYDPLYRLTEATGREYAANPSNPWDYMPAGGNANDPSQTRAYTESYDYDTVGNMTKLTHDYGAGSGTWTRDYVTESTTNRLDQMTSAGGTHQYTYDDAGNLTSENTDRKYEWDARGRMRSFRNQVSGSQATVFAHYTYDGGGQRVQKVVSKDSGKPVHSVYIGGIFEHHERIDGGTVDAEVNHLHVMDDQKRVAIERVGSELDGSNPPTTQYHLGDHLQSSNVVLDGTGTLFNREEYRPFGESSFGSYENKRYRFTGQERDEESSLSYHGARYYAPWTAQWTSPDPKGMVDGTNLYGYSRNNPVNRTDPGGMQSKDQSENGSWPELNLMNRGLGLVMGTAGLAEMAVGGAGIIAPEPTLTLGGGLLFTHGVDTAWTGGRMLLSGRSSETTTERVIEWGMRAGGASNRTAERVGFLGDATIGIGLESLTLYGTKNIARGLEGVDSVFSNPSISYRSLSDSAQGLDSAANALIREHSQGGAELSRVNALSSLRRSEGDFSKRTTTVVRGGEADSGADIVFKGSQGRVTGLREVKAISSTKKIPKHLSKGLDQARGGEIVIQVPKGTSKQAIERQMGSFWGKGHKRKQVDLAKQGNRSAQEFMHDARTTNIQFVDPSGKVIRESQPVYNPPE